MANDSLTISYLQIRKSVGYLGITLPIILALYSFIFGPCNELQSSLSQYYYTAAGNLFTGFICAISFFLYSYKGYDSTDNRAGTTASILGFATAIFPTGQKELFCNFTMNPYPFPSYFTYIHAGAAALFFIVLAYFCIKLFTKSGNDYLENGGKTIKNFKPITNEKRTRNKIYKACGIIIISCLILMAVVYLNKNLNTNLANYKPIFILETIMLWAFGFAWLVKGEVIFEDK